VAGAEAAALVEHQGDAAVGTAQRLPAGAADDDRGGATTVEEEDRLPPGVGALGQGALQGERQRAAIAGAQLLAQVDDLDRGQRPPRDAVGQAGELEVAAVSAEEGLQARRRRAQHHRGAAQPAQLEGGLDGVVAGHAVLLVGGGVLLVDHHHAELGDRREDGAARAHHHVGPARADAPPGGRPLRVGERRVEQRHSAGEAGREAADGLRGEADLGHQHQRPAARRERGGDGHQVDLGLAAAGHPAEQQAVVAALGEGPQQRSDGRPLRLGERRRGLGGGHLGGGERPPRGGAGAALAAAGARGAHPGGEHRLDHLAERRPVARRHPEPKLDQVGEQRRRLVEHLEDGARLELGARHPLDHVADDLALAERHPHPCAGHRALGLADAHRVGEGVARQDGAQLGDDGGVAEDLACHAGHSDTRTCIRVWPAVSSRPRPDVLPSARR
jgi:hypothetical protein